MHGGRVGTSKGFFLLSHRCFNLVWRDLQGTRTISAVVSATPTLELTPVQVQSLQDAAVPSVISGFLAMSQSIRAPCRTPRMSTGGKSRILGYLTHKKKSPPWNSTVGLCLGFQGGPGGLGVFL